MGTKKGQVRKTARRAYEPKKKPKKKPTGLAGLSPQQYLTLLKIRYGKYGRKK